MLTHLMRSLIAFLLALICAPGFIKGEPLFAADTTRLSADVNDPCSVFGKTKPPQEDILDLARKIFKKPANEKEKAKKASLQIVPSISENPELGLAFGGAMSLVGYRESEEQNVSSVQASAVFSTKSQFLIVARSDLTLRNFWHFMGDWRFYKYTERTYGLGSDTSANDFSDISYKWFRFRQGALVPLLRSFEAGLEYDLEDHFEIEPKANNEHEPGTTTTSSGIGLVGLYNSTDNRINASRGIYARATYRFFLQGLGSDNNWQSLDAEARWYYRIPSCRRQILAFWALSQLVTTGEAPYFDLPSNGWDTYNRTARGYTAGRFRGRGWLYGEVEYRADLTQSGLVGAVVFFNASSFAGARSLQFKDWNPGSGAGLRLKIDKRTGSNVTLDFGFGQHGSSGVYIAFNETF